MALDNLFNAMKREGFIVQDLDYFLSAHNEENNRASDVNSPSSAGACLRQRYYTRTEEPQNSGGLSDPRMRRILDNGHGVHDRIQRYLTKQGMLVMDEIPVIHEGLNVQGHTDGLVKISAYEYAVLEIKSINSRGFTNLRGAREDHVKQGLTYVFCIELRRQELHDKYDSLESFEADKTERYAWYASRYQHLSDGKRYTRDEKIAEKCELHNTMDTLLLGIERPVTKVIFLYENKDTQELKEYCISSDKVSSHDIMFALIDEFKEVNEAIATKTLPDRITDNPNDFACRWCNYRKTCWGKDA